MTTRRHPFARTRGALLMAFMGGLLACDATAPPEVAGPTQTVAALSKLKDRRDAAKKPAGTVDPVSVLWHGKPVRANRGDLVVRFAPETGPARRRAIAHDLGGVLDHTTRREDTVLIRLVGKQRVEDALALAGNVPEVAYAQPNVVLPGAGNGSGVANAPPLGDAKPDGTPDPAAGPPDAPAAAGATPPDPKDPATPAKPDPGPPKPLDPEVVADHAAPWSSIGAWYEPTPTIAAETATYYPYAWYLQRGFAHAAWNAAPSLGAGVRVAVLDSGVSPSPSLPAARIAAGMDFIDHDGDPTDGNGHGTHMATIIAGADVVPGVAPAATIVPVRVLDDALLGTELALVEGLLWVADQPDVAVVNMSLAFPPDYYPSPLLLEAIDAVAARGVVMVAASGNDGLEQVAFPARCPEVIAVGAARMARAHGDLGFERADYANHGAALDLVAFGGDVTRDADLDGVPDGLLGERPETASGPAGVYLTAGTSPAAALVSGAAALLRGAGVPTVRIRRLLQATTQPLAGGARAFDAATGMGLLNVGQAADAVARGYAHAIAPPAPSYYAATAFVLERQDNGNLKTKGRAFVELSDAAGAPLGDVSVFGHLDGATREDVAADADAFGHAQLTGATFVDTAASFFAFSVDAVIEPATGLPVRPVGLAHVDTVSFGLLANLGGGLDAGLIALAYTPEAVATLPGVNVDRVVPSYTLQSLGTGLISSALIFVTSPAYFEKSGLYRSAVLFDTRGTGLISSAIVLSEALFAPAYRTLLGTDRVQVRNVTAGSGLISSAVIWRGQFYPVSAFFVGTDPAIVRTYSGAGLISSALVFNRAILSPTLLRSAAEVTTAIAPVQGTGLISSALVFPYEPMTVTSLGFSWSLMNQRYPNGTGLISSALVLTLNPYTLLARSNTSALTSWTAGVAYGASVTTSPWEAPKD